LTGLNQKEESYQDNPIAGLRTAGLMSETAIFEFASIQKVIFHFSVSA
jgi:hypothetical protein